MAGKRKYPEVSGFWVYSISVPSIGKFYIGVSKRQCSHRWRKAKYKGKSLEPYLDEWDSMEKTVLIDGLTREEALKYEDNIIRALSMNDLCINKQRSGLITNDRNAYMKELLKNNTEYRERQNQRAKQYYEDNKEKILEQQRQQRLKKKLEKQTNQTSLPL